MKNGCIPHNTTVEGYTRTRTSVGTIYNDQCHSPLLTTPISPQFDDGEMAVISPTPVVRTKVGYQKKRKTTLFLMIPPAAVKLQQGDQREAMWCRLRYFVLSSSLCCLGRWSFRIIFGVSHQRERGNSI